jgi:arylsulfatase
MRDRDRYVYRPHGALVPESVAVNVRNRTHTVDAEVDVPGGVTPNGVLIALGSVLGGWVLYLLDGQLRYVHNLAGKQRDRITSDVVVGPGPHRLGFRFDKTGEFRGRGTLLVDGDEVGTGDIGFFTPVRFTLAGSGLSVGYELGPAISDDYTAPFTCNVGLRRVIVEVHGEPEHDPQAEFEAIMREQ